MPSIQILLNENKNYIDIDRKINVNHFYPIRFGEKFNVPCAKIAPAHESIIFRTGSVIILLARNRER